jgi:hypothetical protein
MPSLSFDKTKGARPIAIVKGGEYDGNVVYIHEDDHKGKRPKLEINPNTYATEMRELKPQERTKLIARLQEAYAKGLASDQLIGESSLAKQLYDRILSDSAKTTKIDLPPDDGQFQLVPSPDPERREVFYIAGASGSGKSYIAKGIAEYYKKLFPDREVYLISKLQEDATLDQVKDLKRINIKTLIDDYPSLEEFENCCVIFDDYDTFTGDAEKVIHKLIDDLATMGRHTKTTMLCLSHYLTNYKKTRLLLNEATHIIVYPMATSFHALGYLLKTHVGMTKDDVRDLKKLGLWVCVF